MPSLDDGMEKPPVRCPITGLIDCQRRTCELHYMDAPLNMGPEWAGLELNHDPWDVEERDIPSKVERDYLD